MTKKLLSTRLGRCVCATSTCSKREDPMRIDEEAWSQTLDRTWSQASPAVVPAACRVHMASSRFGAKPRDLILWHVDVDALHTALR